MIDTQETNLPEETIISSEENGKLETSQEPVLIPATAQSGAELPIEEVVHEKDAEQTETSAQAQEQEATEDLQPEAETEEAEPEPEVEAEVATELKAETEAEPDVEVEVEAESDPEAELESDSEDISMLSKSDIATRLREAVDDPKKYSYNGVEALKNAYFKMRNAEIEALKKAFLESEEGREEKDFSAPLDETDNEIRTLINLFKDKRAALTAEEERQKEANLIQKQHLIERLKVLTESHEDFKSRLAEFRDIQRKWKEIKSVPQEHAKELWRSYQLYNERFYDIIKINNQFREYDYKKNLDMKTVICETVERLANEDDHMSAYFQLQKLHEQWREIGPVSKEYRDAIWNRYRAASNLVNQKYQNHLNGLRAQEELNLEKKTAICEAIENIDFEALKTMKDWDKKTNEILDMQKQWRTIGFATKKYNAKIFERYRAACDAYFNKKTAFLKNIKKEMEKNLDLKRALVAKAESLKVSTDWKETTRAFLDLQAEWKKIGKVGRRHSEVIWKQFNDACNFFFENKNSETSSHKTEETANFERKKSLLEKVKALDVKTNVEAAIDTLRTYINEWNSIGFVPFKEKDKLNKEFHEAVDKQFDALKVNDRDRRLQQFRSNISEHGGTKKLLNERDKLMRTFDRMKSELQTYENNIGFLNISSKGGNGLLKEMDRKIGRLKEEMNVIVKKIETIDENLN